MNTHIQKVSDFIESERVRYSGDDNNRFAIACEGIQKRYETVWMLYEKAMSHTNRFSKLMEVQYKAARNGDVTKLAEVRGEMSPLHDELIFLFESFFIFGTILCDEIVQLIGFLFGEARGIKFGTHRELSKNWKAYAEAKGIEYDPTLVKLATYLEKELCEIRDKQIVHDFHPRKIDFISCGFPEPRLQYCCGGYIYPKETDVKVESRPWDELIETIRQYVEMQIDVIRRNGNSRFTLKS
jgi:hypothetical protein